MANTETPAYGRALALGFICGLRCMMGPAMAAEMAPPIVRIGLRVLSVGELVGDKLPQTPNRTDPLPLIGRVVSGLGVGWSVCRKGSASPWVGALLGGVAALGGTYGGYYARKAIKERLNVPDTVVALAEDTLAIAIGRHFRP